MSADTRASDSESGGLTTSNVDQDIQIAEREPGVAFEPRTEEREVTCGGRTYLIRRFPDGVIGLYDKSGRLTAGWPVTAQWQMRSLIEESEADLCAQIRRLFQTS